MALHGLGRGWLTTYVSAGSVVLNIALNYLFAWKLQMGPVGIYVSTFFISVLSAGLHLWMLDRKISIQSFQWLKMSFYRNLFVTIFPEMGRVASERLLAFVLLGLFTFLGSPSESMQAFVICSEFLFLLTAPLVALMRSVAVLSAQNQERMKKSMKFFEEPLLLLLICGLGVLVFAYSPFIFEKLYKVHQYTDWYGTFVWALPFYIVAKWGNSIYRGYLQSQKKLKAIFWVDSIGQWTLLIPLSAWAIYQNSPMLFWGGWVFVEVLSWMVLFVLWQPGIRYRVAPLLRIKRRA
jgi:Na+-driven multidrug efflux pump